MNKFLCFVTNIKNLEKFYVFFFEDIEILFFEKTIITYFQERKQ